MSIQEHIRKVLGHPPTFVLSQTMELPTRPTLAEFGGWGGFAEWCADHGFGWRYDESITVFTKRQATARHEDQTDGHPLLTANVPAGTRTFAVQMSALVQCENGVEALKEVEHTLLTYGIILGKDGTMGSGYIDRLCLDEVVEVEP